MGPDIHCVVEIQPYDDIPSHWREVVLADSAIIDRNYDEFAHWFGVRNTRGVTPKWAFRGLPDDVSEFTKEASREDAHSHTYVTLSELAEVDMLWPDLMLVFELMLKLAGRFGFANVRLVVWFDN